MDEKPWWQSKTIWGAIITLGAAVLPLFHWSMSAADQATLTDLITAVAAGIGGILTIYGRVKAKPELTR